MALPDSLTPGCQLGNPLPGFPESEKSGDAEIASVDRDYPQPPIAINFSESGAYCGAMYEPLIGNLNPAATLTLPSPAWAGEGSELKLIAMPQPPLP